MATIQRMFSTITLLVVAVPAVVVVATVMLPEPDTVALDRLHFVNKVKNSYRQQV